MSVGTVFLVGAGPGDPKLLTVGGKDALSKADVVVYDRLVHPTLLTYVQTSAELIYVGKQADRHTLTQDKINIVLSEKALEGKEVVRLKGGDPFVFGRGGEEAEHLRSLNIPFVIIPGVTSAIAAPAYAGIPVTHRDAASSFAVITGHERTEGRESGGRNPGDAEERRRWDRIAHAADTLIFLMGVESLGEITSRLIENGRSQETPVALVRWGTWASRQETITGILGTIAADVAAAGFKAPAVTVIGDVVSWRSRLQWFDNRPLFGKRIVVTRARSQNSEILEILQAEGADAIEFPTIKIVPPADGYAELDTSIQSIHEFNWIAYTSVNAVTHFFARLNVAGKDARALAGIKICAVGAATEAALARYGITADFKPKKFVGEEAAAEFPVNPVGLKILVPSAKLAAETFTDAMIGAGADVVSATAYENVVDTGDAAAMLERIKDGEIDTVTFTSSSTVKNFFSALNADPTVLNSVKIACIGPSTAQTAFDLFGRKPDILAQIHSIPGLVDALKNYFVGSN